MKVTFVVLSALAVMSPSAAAFAQDQRMSAPAVERRREKASCFEDSEGSIRTKSGEVVPFRENGKRLEVDQTIIKTGEMEYIYSEKTGLNSNGTIVYAGYSMLETKNSFNNNILTKITKDKSVFHYPNAIIEVKGKLVHLIAYEQNVESVILVEGDKKTEMKVVIDGVQQTVGGVEIETRNSPTRRTIVTVKPPRVEQNDDGSTTTMIKDKMTCVYDTIK